MKKQPKILIACPVSSYKSYVLPAWLLFVKKHFSKYDVLLVDNSPKPDFSRSISKLGYTVIYRKPYQNERINETMSACLNIILKYAIENHYDYWFSLECDIFPPVDVIDRLLAHGRDVVSGCYNIGFGENRRLMLQYPFEKKEADCDIRNVTQFEGFEAVNGKLIRVFGCGIGCCLIRLPIIHEYQFRTDPSLKVHADTFLYIDMYEKEIGCYLDTSIFCTHKNSNWNKIYSKDAKRIR